MGPPSKHEQDQIVSILTSILVASPPFTMGTVLPACILYGPIECPFRFRIGFTT